MRVGRRAGGSAAGVGKPGGAGPVEAGPVEAAAARRAAAEPPAAQVHGVPGWALHLAVAAAALGLVAAAVDPGVWSVGVFVTLCVVAVAAGVLPWSPAPITLMAAAAACQLFTGHDVLDARLLLTAVLLQVVHVLAALAAVVPLWSRVDPRALLPSARRLAIVAVLSLPVFLADRFVGPGLGSGALFIGCAVAVLALLGGALYLGSSRAH